MPCTDYRPSTVYEERLHDGVNAARLCGIMTVLKAHGLDEKVLNVVDWKAAGTSRSKFDRWWIEHQKIDASRKAKEAKVKAERAKAKQLSQRPWAKLTAEERRLVQRYES